MKYVRRLFSALICASLCLAVGAVQAQQANQAQGAASAPRATANKSLLVGVVDLRAVLQNHPVVAEEIPALNAKLQQEQVALAKAKQEADQKIADMQQKYDFKYGTPEFEEQIGSIRKEFSDAEFKANEASQKVVAQRTQLLFKAYKDLQTAIQTVAVKNGIIIVHSKVKISAPQNSNISEEVLALEEADQNTIVWNRPECDITEAVKQQLAAAVGTPSQASEGDSPLANLGGQAMNAANGAAARPAAAQPRTAAPRTANAAAGQQRR